MGDTGPISEVSVTKVNGICRIEIRRPEKKNALTRHMYSAMADAIKAADADVKVRVIFLHGSDDFFCAGNDLKEFQEVADNPELRPADGNPFLQVISRAEKPMIAAVTGPAIGVGTTMLLHCDLVYAGKSARFSMPFVNLGLCPEAASSFLLPRLVGHQRASEMLFLGEPFSAEQAREFGLVNAVYPDETVIEKAFARAQKVAQQPPESIRLTKSLLKRSVSEAVEDTMREELVHFSKRLASAECREALAAFFARRKPDFSTFS